MKTHRMLFDWTTIVLAIMITVVVGLRVFKYVTKESHADGVELVPPPEDLYELVHLADVITVGEIDSVIDSGLYAGYSGATFLEIQTPTPSSSITATPYPLAAIPFIDIEIDEEVVLKEDNANNDHVLRMAAPALQDTSVSCSDAGRVYPPGDTGERFMWFLRQNPDGSYGIAGGPYDRIILGQEITYSDCDETAVEFATGMDEDDFVSAVETQIAGPTRTPTITPTPTSTRTPTATRTPTPTPCSGPGC